MKKAPEALRTPLKKAPEAEEKDDAPEALRTPLKKAPEAEKKDEVKVDKLAADISAQYNNVGFLRQLSQH